MIGKHYFVAVVVISDKEIILNDEYGQLGFNRMKYIIITKSEIRIRRLTVEFDGIYMCTRINVMK